MPKTSPVTNHERARMRALRRAEMSVEAIGAELGRSGRCVCEHVRDIPVRCRPGRPGRDAAGNDRLLAAHAAGVERHEIAERFGLKPQSVMPIISRILRLRAAQAGSADRDQKRIA